MSGPEELMQQEECGEAWSGKYGFLQLDISTMVTCCSWNYAEKIGVQDLDL